MGMKIIYETGILRVLGEMKSYGKVRSFHADLTRTR